jgi:hypothetical protein
MYVHTDIYDYSNVAEIVNWGNPPSFDKGGMPPGKFLQNPPVVLSDDTPLQ